MGLTLIFKKNRSESTRSVSFGSRPVPKRTVYQAPSNVAGRQLSVVVPGIEAMEPAERKEHAAYLREKLQRDDITDEALEQKITESHNPKPKVSIKPYIQKKLAEKERAGRPFTSTP